MFREMVAPRFKKIIDFIKSRSEAKVIYHTCGATYFILPDLIEIGVDIVHPLQANARGNENPEELKKSFGKKLYSMAIQTTRVFFTNQKMRLSGTLF